MKAKFLIRNASLLFRLVLLFFSRLVKLTPENFPALEQKMKEIVDHAHPFVMKEYPIEELEKKFKMNPFKLHILQGIKQKGPTATTYTSGRFEDLCRGPHVSDTGLCHFFHLTKITEASFNVSPTETKPVQRVYGVCFETPEQEEQYQKLLAAAQRDHQKIGKVFSLFVA